MSAVTDYLAAVRANLAQGQATEHTHRPALQALLESVGGDITATNEPRRIACGSPDFQISRKRVPIGHVETKDVGARLDEMERGKGPHGEQFRRYRAALPNWVLTDYLEFRWYVNGEKRLTARLADLEAQGKLRVAPFGEASLSQLLQAFFGQAALTIGTARDLAQRMAAMTRILRDLIVKAFEHETEKGFLHHWLAAFREVLIPDLKEAPFADMFAQTVAYGLFAARVHTPPGKNFSREMAAFSLPKTNPFLRKLFSEIAGVDMPETIAWAVDDVVSLLRHADLAEILRDFGRGQGKPDPVVHFYETFLAAYDPKLREVRGVYYTPEPVVGYIVRSVDHLLKTRFQRPKGLADENTLILDPATGTATFLYSVIDHIHRGFARQKGAWDSYVARHLLNRLFGFELLMAPYAIAHLKLGMQLAETGYPFGSDQRLGVYLTNSLEQTAQLSEQKILAFVRELSAEADAAADIKGHKEIMVVLGNPPYSGISANRGAWITEMINDYRQVGGVPLGEKKLWLKNDYVKFLRFGQWRIERTGHGILAFITDHSYLDSPTFRGMRQHLLKTFHEIFVLNLHGNAKRRETSPDGGPDENVFDITQGVAIALFVKRPEATAKHAVFYADLWGGRQDKYQALARSDVSRTPWKALRPAGPFFEFVHRQRGARTEYQAGWPVKDVFGLGSNGVQTSRDGLVVAFDSAELVRRLETFADPDRSVAEVRAKFFGAKSVADYPAGDTREWKLTEARAALQQSDRQWRSALSDYLYRPFDRRALLYLDSMVDWPRREAMHHLQRANRALCVGRAGLVTSGPWDLVFCSDQVCDHNLFYRGSSLNFPLYLYDGEAPPRKSGGKGALLLALFDPPGGYAARRANLNPRFSAHLTGRLGLKWLPVDRGDLKKTLGPEDVFHYAYAVFHAPTYRTRYAEFLKVDFPRLPLTSDLKVFRALAAQGAELVALHLMASPQMDAFITGFPETGDNVVEQVQHTDQDQRVWINARQYFSGVPRTVWEFRIGGYQVCEKWLKDRRGRALTCDDLQHYQRTVLALGETIRLMAEIDRSIPGWPLV